MNQPDLRQLLQRYQQGECSPEQIRVVEQWYDLLGHEQPPLTLTPAERQAVGASLWQRIEAQTLQGEDLSPPAGRPWQARGRRWAAAAALLLGLGLGARQVLSPPSMPQAATARQQATSWQLYHNATARAHTLRLHDGSTVRVEPGGQLKYPRHFAARHRTVYLKGAAFFNIYHDAARPFQVYTNKVVTAVLGTSFWIEAPEGREPVVVKVRSGRVRVTPLRPATTAAGPASVVLLPNQQAVYSPVGQQLQHQLVDQPVQLLSQSFEFDDQPVAVVLAALEKAYGVDISYEASQLAGCRVTLSLHDESLYGKLEVLCKTLGATYDKSETHIRFRSAGCASQ